MHFSQENGEFLQIELIVKDVETAPIVDVDPLPHIPHIVHHPYKGPLVCHHELPLSELHQLKDAVALHLLYLQVAVREELAQLDVRGEWLQTQRLQLQREGEGEGEGRGGRGSTLLLCLLLLLHLVPPQQHSWLYLLTIVLVLYSHLLVYPHVLHLLS